MKLAEEIKRTKVSQGEIALFYLAQAGFCIKTYDDKIAVIDAYLSDACERLFNFRRMIPKIIKAEELNADLHLSTHEHADHLDPDSLPIFVKNIKTFFVGSPDCEEYYKRNNILDERYRVLNEGEEWGAEGIKIRAIYADHGDISPLANGLLMDIQGIKIYHSGDTCFSPGKIKRSLKTDVDIMIIPINGKYGNMNAYEACKLASVIKPKFLIACHFWMFLEHVTEGGNGDPATFLKESAHLTKEIKVKVMAPGELIKYSQ